MFEAKFLLSVLSVFLRVLCVKMPFNAEIAEMSAENAENRAK